MTRSARAASEALAIITIIVLGAIIAVAVLLLLPGQTGSTQQTSDQSTTGSLSVVTSSLSSTTSTPQMGNSNLSSLVISLKDYFGNFSRLTVGYRLNESNETASYDVLNHSVINSSEYFEVNFTLSNSILHAGYQNTSAVILFDGSGVPIMMTVQGSNYTGGAAQNESASFTAPFTTMLQYTSLFLENRTNLGLLQFAYQNSTSIGQTAMTVVTYDFFTALTIKPGTTLFSALIMLGTVSTPGETPVSLLTYFTLKTTEGVSFGTLISATRA